ncbi:hypothetical protein H671_2g6336 [Cricetulus griseus]|uniref:Uncharacterized protein n=1 Tax=Cricetulus griseus TaxID=10029 RepID=A0A061IHZ5_CRIGR|nr:hypothetical protein H671_2g6336 [Cricetulus griseus]
MPGPPVQPPSDTGLYTVGTRSETRPNTDLSGKDRGMENTTTSSRSVARTDCRGTGVPDVALEGLKCEQADCQNLLLPTFPQDF